jgi:glycosyltransferase involved in cell wall biosynthesis
MKVLVISPYPLLPPIHGGRVRAAGLAAGLARAGATVAVLCPWYPEQPLSGELEERLSIHSHFLPFNLLPVALPRPSASPLALLSLQPRSPWGPRRRLAEFADFDVFQLEFCANARWIDLLPPGGKVVYSAHNVERDFFQANGNGNPLRRWSLQRLEVLEREIVRRSDLILACSGQDAARLDELYGGSARKAVVPNGTDPALLRLDRDALRESARAALGFGPEDRVLLFLGGDASHNREAVEFLVGRVLPELDPSTRLLLVGRCGGPKLRPRDHRVVSIGFVPDLAVPLAAADLAVNPVRQGTGSNVKLAEYLAARLPIVSTPVGIRGFEELAGAVRVAPREEFADALRGPPPVPASDRAALEFLTWDALGRGLLDEYTQLVEDRERAAAPATV